MAMKVVQHMISHLNGDLIDLVEDVDAWNVNAIALDHVNQIIYGRVAAESDIDVVDFVLACALM